MKCTVCNKEINNNAKFCTYCGALVTATTEEKKSVGKAEQERRCTSCYKLATGTEKFCTGCGTLLPELAEGLAENPVQEEKPAPSAPKAEEKAETPVAETPKAEESAPAPVSAPEAPAIETKPEAPAAPIAEKEAAPTVPLRPAPQPIVQKVAPVQDISSSSPKKKGGALAFFAYFLYILSTALLVAVVILFFSILNPFKGGKSQTANGTTSSIILIPGPNINKQPGANAVVSGTTSVTPENSSSEAETSSETPTLDFGNHKPYTILTEDVAEKLVHIYTDYCHWGVCPSGATEFGYEEGKELLRQNNWGTEEEIDVYTVCALDECESIQEVDYHMSLYLTESLIYKTKIQLEQPLTQSGQKVRTEIDGRVFFFIGARGWSHYTIVDGSLKEENGVWKAAFTVDYIPEVYWATFVIENGNFKLYDFDIENTVEIVENHPLFLSVTEENINDLTHILAEYAAYGICPGPHSEELSYDEATQILASVGIENNEYIPYSVYKMEVCFTVDDMEDHIRYYLTDRMASSVYTPGGELNGRDFFSFEVDYQTYVASSQGGLEDYWCEPSTLRKVDDHWEADLLNYNQEIFPNGAAVVFVMENGLVKIDSIIAK